MIHKKRRVGTAVWFSLMILIFILAYMKAPLPILLTLLVFETMAGIWYAASYIPWGRKMIISCCQASFFSPCPETLTPIVKQVWVSCFYCLVLAVCGVSVQEPAVNGMYNCRSAHLSSIIPMTTNQNRNQLQLFLLVSRLYIALASLKKEIIILRRRCGYLLFLLL